MSATAPAASSPVPRRIASLVEAGRFDAVMATPFGRVGVRVANGAVHEITYLPPDTPVRSPVAPLAARAVVEIERYLDDPRYRPELPLARAGTDFQRRVWSAISAIAPGASLTYGGMAKALGSSARAVGQACGSNPYPLVVPCHRVLAASGLGGFAHASDGFLLVVKRWLLAHEGVPVPGGRVAVRGGGSA